MVSIVSDRAPEGDDEGDGEFEDEAVEEGGHWIFAAGGGHYDREGGVHRGDSGGGDGGEGAGESREERGEQEGGHLPYDVGQQGDGAELGATVAGYEYAGEGVVAETGAYGEAVGGWAGGKDQRGDERSGESAHDGADREQGHTDIKGAELGDDLSVAADADSDAEKQGAQGIEGQVPLDQRLRDTAGQPHEDA